MSHCQRLLPLAVLLLPWAATAQDIAEIGGSWVARYNTPGGNSREAKLEIAGRKGTWQVRASDRNNPCVGRLTPVAISDFDGKGYTLDFLGSQALQGCPDLKVVVTREGDKAWSTEFAGGRKVAITRE